MYFAGQCDSASRSSLQQRLTPATTLAGLTQLAHLGANTADPAVIMTQYQLSGETVKWIVRQQGEEALLKLYSSFAAEIPDLWLKSQSRGAQTQAAARLLIGRRIMAKVFADLSIEGLDALVRQSLAQ